MANARKAVGAIHIPFDFEDGSLFFAVQKLNDKLIKMGVEPLPTKELRYLMHFRAYKSVCIRRREAFGDEDCDWELIVMV